MRSETREFSRLEKFTENREMLFNFREMPLSGREGPYDGPSLSKKRLSGKFKSFDNFPDGPAHLRTRDPYADAAICAVSFSLPSLPPWYLNLAVFLSGLNQMTCTNGHLKPDFFECVFEIPGGGEGGRGSVEVRGKGDMQGAVG